MRRREVAANESPHLSLLLGVLSPLQRKFLLDPSRRKIARCGRRAGKSFVDAAYLIYECLLKPMTPVLYAGLTRDSAKATIWPILTALLEELKIPHTLKLSTLTIDFPNGSNITVFGCDATNAKNRLRGRKFKLAIFDETGFYSSLDAIVYAVLPMLADYAGTLVLTSSPGELLSGFFYEADQGKTADTWSRYFWTIHDNPFFQVPALDQKKYAGKTRADEELGEVLELEFGGDAELPGYRREWLGQWAKGDKSFIYPYTQENLRLSPKRVHDEYAMAIGFGPLASIVTVARYSEYSRNFEIVHQWKRDDLDLDDFVKEVWCEYELWSPSILVSYQGDFKDDVTLEMKRRYRLPLIPMKAGDKSFHQRIFAQDLKNGYIRIKPGLQLLSEFDKIVRDSKGDEIAGQVNQAADVVLALYRKVYQTHLSTYTAPLSEEELHIKQLEDSVHEPEVAWYDRY